jgi:hypothetical protein
MITFQHGHIENASITDAIYKGSRNPSPFHARPEDPIVRPLLRAYGEDGITVLILNSFQRNEPVSTEVNPIEMLEMTVRTSRCMFVCVLFIILKY